MEPLPATEVIKLGPGDGADDAGGDQPYPEAPVAEDGMEGLPEVHGDMVAEPDQADERNWALDGEALAAVSGLFPKGPITREQGAEAEALLSKVGEAAKKFSKFGEFGAFKMRKRPDFEEVWTKLQPLTEAETEIATAGLADPDLIDAWGNAVNAARATARAVWPVQIRDTPTGPDWVDPGRLEGGRAADVLAALNDPLSMLDDLQRGSLTPPQVEAVEAAYPELMNRIREIYSNELKQRDGKRCPWAHEVQLRVLFGAPAKLVNFGAGDTSAKETKGGSEIQIDFEQLRTKGQSVR